MSRVGTDRGGRRLVLEREDVMLYVLSGVRELGRRVVERREDVKGSR